jgi:tRNA pseudouridine38-40 synthase
MRTALKFAYDGRKYYGFARQPQLKTVEGDLIKSLIKHGIIEDTNESMFRSSSRTDKGVSCFGNVVAFNTETPGKKILNLLSKETVDVIPFGVKEVNDGFNPRYAKYRHYRYYLPKKDLDVDEIIKTSSVFTGQHDFTNFARIEQGRDPVRTIDNIVFDEQKNFLVIDFFAQTFLWNQIRRIVSALEKIGRKKITREMVVEALCNPDKNVDYGLASAEPLFLMDVSFGFDFEINNVLFERVEDLKSRVISF